MPGVHNEEDWYLSFFQMTILIGEWYGHVLDARGRGKSRELEAVYFIIISILRLLQVVVVDLDRFLRKPQSPVESDPLSMTTPFVFGIWI